MDFGRVNMETESKRGREKKGREKWRRELKKR